MKKTGLTLFACLCTILLIQANTIYPLSLSVPAEGQLEVLCNLSAPTNFKSKGVGSTTVKLVWDYQPDAVGGYRIQTFKASDNSLVNTTFKSQDILEAVIDGLTPGTEYYSRINSICSNGENSTIYNETSFITLILELVVVGYQGNNSPAICTISGSGGSCHFSNQQNLINHFRVSRGSISSNFGVRFKPGRIQVLLPEGDPYFDYFCDNSTPPLPKCEVTNNAEIYMLENAFANFMVRGGEEYTATLTATIASTCSGCKIEYQGGSIEIGLQAPDPSYTGLRSGLPNTPDFAAVAPNPFNDRLQVYVDDLTAESVHCQLFNVNGQKVLDQQFQGAQDTYELITENLANGFYLLRVEANGMVQTLRVIKAE